MVIVAEVWRDVIGNSFYQVSDLGRVRSVDRVVDGSDFQRRVKGRILKPGDVKGYRNVVLCRYPDKKRNRRVHQLVAEAFIGPCPEGLQINHKDCDKTNNVPENLEYVTHGENIRHAYENGLNDHEHLIGENSPNTVLKESEIREIHCLVSEGMRLGIAMQQVGVRASKSAVCMAINGVQWKHLNLKKERET